MRWLAFCLLGLLLLAGTALAESQISVITINNDITPLEEASYYLAITNNADEKQKYSIYSLQSGQEWDVETSPLKDKIFELNPGESKQVKILARPLQDLTPKIHFVYVTVETDLGERYDQALKVYLSSPGPVNYLPIFKVTVDMDEKIVPQEPVQVKLFLENRNPLNLTGLKVEIQSDIPEFNKEAVIDLPPLGSKTVEFSIIPNQYQQPKEYNLFFVFSRYGEVVKVVDQKIEVLSLLPPFLTELSEEKVFLKSFRQIKITNAGNVLNTQKAKVPATFWEAWFTSGADSERIEGQRYLVWELELAPGESQTFGFITNYRWILYLLGIIILFSGFYWYVKSPLTLYKKAVATPGEEETLSEIKVTLELRNHSKKAVKEITVTDHVPGIANIEQGLELGTLKPKEVVPGKKKTKVVWALSELDADEQRIITYKIKTKLRVVGSFSLPRATVEFKKGKRRKGKAYSNLFNLSNG